MGQKTLQVHLRVSEGQHAYMRRKASSYGIPLSRLVLTAVEAYVRAYDEGLGDANMVVVNYSVWSAVDRHLGGIESVLRESAQQMVGIRWALAAAARKGTLTWAEADRAYRTLKSTREDVARIRETVERMGQLVDDVCDAAHLVDPYLGPMEGACDLGFDGEEPEGPSPRVGGEVWAEDGTGDDTGDDPSDVGGR